MMGKLIEFFKKHPIIKTLVQMIIVFFLLIGITLYGLKLYTRHGKAVLVPDVKAMALPDALRTLDREGFRYDIIDSLFIDEAVPGTIVEQTPAGGSKVKEGRIVYLSINAYSPRMITCPKVVDMSMRQALSLLESRGLSCEPGGGEGEKYQFYVSDLAEKFTAFATSILPDAVRETRKINIEEF